MPSQEVLTLLIDAKNLASKELAGLQRDLRKSSDESDRFNLVLRRGATIASGALSAGFAMATRGAFELADVQARLQAETGKSADEAHNMALAINEIAGATNASIPAVSAAFSKVVTDLGLSGKAAEDTTKLFVRFGKVTGQEAASAVSSLDDILDAWKLTAADTETVMNKLIVSHQKYGGVISDNEAALAALAPGMTALNMTVDDAIALLNLFSASGIDAAIAVAGIQKALKNVSSPEEFRRLIVDIAKTEDGFARAKKAVDLFGKSGAQLGSALAGADLEKFGISATDAAGALNKAGDAMESTFPAQIGLAMSRAQAAVRGFGDTFGTILTGLATAATFWGPFSAGFNINLGARIASSAFAAPVIGGVAAAGSAIGRALGFAIAQAVVLAPVALVVAAAAAAAWATTENVNGIRMRALQAIAEKNAADIGRVSGQKHDDGFRQGIAAGAGAVAAAGAELGGTVMSAAAARIALRKSEAVDATKETVRDIAGAIRGARADVQSAWRALFDSTISTQNAADQIIVNKAEIAAQKAIANDKDRTAAERAEARIRIRNLQAENKELQKEIADSGDTQKRITALKAQLTSKALMNGLSSNDPVIHANAVALRESIQAELQALEDSSFGYGSHMGTKWADGLSDSLTAVERASSMFAGMPVAFLKTRSPAKRGPLSEQGGPDGMGRHTGEMWAKGLADAVASVERASGNLAGSARAPLNPTAAARMSPIAIAARSGNPPAGGVVHLHVNSMFPPSQAQIAQWADVLDREFRRRQSRFSAYAPAP